MSEASAYPSDWRATTFGALADYVNGYPFKPRDWTTVGLPIVCIAQMTDVTVAFDYFADPLPPDYRIDSGDLLFSWSATLTALIWQRGPAYLNQHIYKVIARNGNDLGFLHHLLNQLIDLLANQSHGTTMKHITRGDLLPYPVTVPPLTEQSRIAAVLDTVDEAIAKTETVIAKLKQVRAGLLHDLLTRGLNENGQLRDPIAHPEQFQDSPIGRIPREWRISTLGAELPLQRGFDITVAHQRQGEIPVVSSSGITSFHDTAMVDGPGVVTGQKGKLGAVFYIDRDFWPHDTSLWVTDFRGNSVKFAALLLSQLRLERFDAATSVPTLNRNTIHPLQLTFPSRSEQEQLASIVETWDESLDSEYKWLDKLQLLKSALMADLLTGRIRVPADLEFG